MAMFGNIFGGSKSADDNQSLPVPPNPPQPITFTPFPDAPPAPTPPAPQSPLTVPVPPMPPVPEAPPVPLPAAPASTEQIPQTPPELRLATPPQPVATQAPQETADQTPPTAQFQPVALPPTFELPVAEAIPVLTPPPVEAAQKQIGDALEKNVADERSYLEKERLDITSSKVLISQQLEQIAQARTALDLLEASITSQQEGVAHSEAEVSDREQSIDQAAAVLN